MRVRILVVTPYLHPEGGGLERYAATVAERLAARGHDITLLGHSGTGGAVGGAAAPRSSVPLRGGSLTRVAVAPRVRLSNTPLSVELARAARRLLRAERFDLVHAHTPVPGAAELAYWAARKERVPFALTYHAGALRSGSPLFAAPAALHRATIERAMIRGARARIAVSGYVAEHVFRGLPHAVAPPGVDAERFTPGGNAVPGRVLYVGPVARAYAWKGLAALAEAVRRVPGATLRAVGDGDLADRYRAQGVDVTGRVTDDRLVEEYRAASVVALPSLTPAESFGMVLAEANACGRPVVGSRVGGIPCFVRDGENGLLAAPGDADDLAAKLARVLADDALARRLGERGRTIVEKEHRWNAVADACLAAFDEATRDD